MEHFPEQYSTGQCKIDEGYNCGSSVKISINGVHDATPSNVIIQRAPAPQEPSGIRPIGRGVKVVVKDEDGEVIEAAPEFPLVPIPQARAKVKIVIGPIDDEGNPIASDEETPRPNILEPQP